MLCLTQPLPSMENVHDVFLGAGVKVVSSRFAVEGKKKILKNKMKLSTLLHITPLAACARFSGHVC